MTLASPRRRAHAHPAHRRRLARRALDALHRQPRLQGRSADHRGGQGRYFTDIDGRKIFDGLSGLWCSGLGHGRPEITEAVSRQIAKLDYSPAFQFGHPLSFELANKIKELTPAGSRLRVLHRLGLRGRRHLAEDGARLLAHQGPGQQDPPDRPREGLPRRELRRHLGGRHRGQPQALRPGRGSRPPAAHAARIERLHARHGRARRRAGRPPARPDRAARRLEHRGRHRGALLGIGRRGDAAQGLPEAPARHLHREQHPADLRRGHHRLRPLRRAHRAPRPSA
jgi:hypothetical protein